MVNHQLIKKYLSIILLVLIMPNVYSGPPYITDDPYPASLHQLQIYLFGQMISQTHNTGILIPALEFDYGGLPRTEFHLVLQALAFLPPTGSGRSFGLTDTEVNIKYALLLEQNNLPQIAIVPTAELPTGKGDRNLGNGRIWYKLPIYFGKTWGDWITFGGGGYVINGAPNTRTFPFFGWVLQRALNERLSLGGEIFTQASAATTRSPPFQDAGAMTIANLGLQYQYSKPLRLLFAGGHSIAGVHAWYGYFALYWEMNF